MSLLNWQSIFMIGICLALCAITCSYRIWKMRIQKVETTSIKRVIVKNLFILYVCSVFSVTLLPIFNTFRDNVSLSINIIPLRGIIHSISRLNSANISELISVVIFNIFGNTLMFIPFGLCMPLLYRKCQKWSNILLFSFIFSLSIEVLQLIEGIIRVAESRIVDIDDIILNVLGGIIGFIIYKTFFAKKGINFVLSDHDTENNKIIL